MLETLYTGHLTVSGTRAQVSLCDLLDSSLDVVFDHGTVYWRRDTTAVWVYFVISIICIYLTSCISDNIVSMVHNTPRTAKQGRKQMISVYGTLALIVYLIYYQDTCSLLLTREDADLTTHLFVYAVALALAQHTDPGDDLHGATGIPTQYAAPLRAVSGAALTPAHTHTGSRISLLTACIALLTLRVHYSFDNPYMLVLCILFGVRSAFKFLSTMILATSISAHALMLVDFFVFCSMLDNGLMVCTRMPSTCMSRVRRALTASAQANSTDVFSGAATQVVLVLVCALTATLVFTYQQCHPAPHAVVAAAREPQPASTAPAKS